MGQQDNRSHSSENDGEVRQFLTFLLSGESYGIGILHIKEIIKHGDVTKVPMMPDFITGVINLRGSVVPVISLAHRFQITPSELSKKTSIIVIEINDNDSTLELGIVVDMVNEVLELRPEQLSEAPSFGTKIRADFIKYMGKLSNDDFIILLDVDNVLSIDELSVVHDVKESTDEGVEVEPETEGTAG